jgi:hypothetical protein
MNNDKKLNNVIEALAKHEDNSAVSVLERVGTNCADDEVRRLTVKALITRNSKEALSIVIANKGKGINDLNTGVAMSSINELLAMKDKTEALKVLNETEEKAEEETVRETARSVKALMDFC